MCAECDVPCSVFTCLYCECAYNLSPIKMPRIRTAQTQVPLQRFNSIFFNAIITAKHANGCIWASFLCLFRWYYPRTSWRWNCLLVWRTVMDTRLRFFCIRIFGKLTKKSRSIWNVFHSSVSQDQQRSRNGIKSFTFPRLLLFCIFPFLFFFDTLFTNTQNIKR